MLTEPTERKTLYREPGYATRWLQSLSPSTQFNYLRWLKTYCQSQTSTPEALLSEAISESQLHPGAQKLPLRISAFLQTLINHGYSPNTISLAMDSIRSFYASHDIYFPDSIRRLERRRRKHNHTTRPNLFTDKPTILSALTQSMTSNPFWALRNTTLLLTMATSGMARQEILNLKIENLTPTPPVFTINITRQKTHIPYTTFTSTETTPLLQTLISNRKPSARVFTKTDGTHITSQITDYLFGELHLQSHSLRRYFGSTLTNAGMPIPLVHLLLGHSRPSLDAAYLELEPNFLLKSYLQFESHLHFGLSFETLLV